MVAPYMAASDGNFVDYNTPNGFAKSGFDYTWSSGDGSAIGTNDIVTYTANGPTAKNGTITCKAFNMGGLNLQSGGASSKLTITSGGLTASGGLDYLQPAVQFGPDGALVEGCVYVASGVNLQFFADVTGASLTKFGPGQLSMTTLTRSLSGLVTVAGGNFYVTWTGASDGTPDRLPNISGYVVNGGTLEFWGHTLVPKNITVGPLGGTVQNLVTSSNFGISGNILAGSPQSGVLTLGGANTGNGLTISGANTYNGGTIVQGGGKLTVASGSSLGTGPVNLVSGTALVLQGNANIASNAPVTVNGTASFQSAGPAIGSLAGGGSVVLGTASVTTTLTAGGDNTDTVFSGAISEAGAGKGRFTKTGTGALTLWGVNTYAGPTIVSNGALTVNGSLGAGAVTVASGATLGGQGTVGGPVTVESGGILAPGDGVGTLTTGDLTLRDNAEFRCEIGASNALDKVVCGALTLGSRGTLRLYDVGTTRSPRGDFVLIQYTGSDPALGDWSIDRGTTGWFTAKVRQNTDENQIILRFAMNPGTVVLIR
jgi:autotransporter-associated beta strand protein